MRVLFFLSILVFQAWSGTGCLTANGDVCFPQKQEKCECAPLPSSKPEKTFLIQIKEFFKKIGF